MNNLIWFRNDLRTQDNQSLFKATKNTGKTIGVYCLDPRQFETNKHGFKKTEKFRAKFLLETLLDLKNNLAALNIPLYIYQDTPENTIPKLVQEHQINAIFLQREWTPDEEEIKQNLQNSANIRDLKWVETYDQFLFHPDDIPYTDFNKIPEVFTEFRKKCEQTCKIRSSVTVAPQPNENFFATSNVLPTLEDVGLESFQLNKNSAFPFRGGRRRLYYEWKNTFLKLKIYLRIKKRVMD